MGGTSSKTTVNQLTDISTKIANSSIQSCVTAASQEQIVKISHTDGNVDLSGANQKQAVSVNMKCVMSNDTQNKIQNEMASQIANFAKSTGGDYTAVGASHASAETNIKNILSSSIDNESISKQMASSLQKQEIAVSDTHGNVIAKGLTQDQGADVISKALISNSQYTGALTKIADKIDSHTEAENKGIFNSMFDALGMTARSAMYGAIALVIAGIIGVAVFFFIRSRRGKVKASGVKVHGLGKVKVPGVKVPALGRAKVPGVGKVK